MEWVGVAVEGTMKLHVRPSYSVPGVSDISIAASATLIAQHHSGVSGCILENVLYFYHIAQISFSFNNRSVCMD